MSLRHEGICRLEGMNDIYAKCEEYGFPKRIAYNFYYRLITFPIKHTRAVIENHTNGKYKNPESITQLKTLLCIMLEVMPHHEKATEWQEAINMICAQNADGLKHESEIT